MDQQTIADNGEQCIAGVSIHVKQYISCIVIRQGMSLYNRPLSVVMHSYVIQVKTTTLVSCF